MEFLAALLYPKHKKTPQKKKIKYKRLKFQDFAELFEVV